MNSLKRLYQKFVFIPSDFNDDLSAKNKRALKILSLFSLYFGIIVYAIVSISFIVTHKQMPFVFSLYYLNFMVIGGINVALLHTKLPAHYLVFLTLLQAESIIVFNLLSTNASNIIIVFIGLMFALLIFLEINPVVFTVELLCFFELLHLTIRNRVQNVPVDNLTLCFFVMVLLAFWKRSHLINEFKRNAQLKELTEKTENLLHNLLPDSVIEQLKSDGKSPPKKYENMTVLLSDIVNFTKISTTVSPYFLISELNEIFTQFDKITESHNCIRIKTIGDAYMAVCGLPEKNASHAENLILCAKDFIQWLTERNKTSQIQWNIRVGLASGSSIAGIIGKKKYLYDILGDTVEYAVKLQNSCMPMHIRLSPQTYKLIEGKIEIPEIVEVDSQTPVTEKGDVKNV